MFIFYNIVLAIFAIVALFLVFLLVLFRPEGFRDTKWLFLSTVIWFIIGLAFAFVPNKVIANKLAEQLPLCGTVEIDLTNEEEFASNANTKLEKFIAKYSKMDDTTLELVCVDNNYSIAVYNQDNKMIDYYNNIHKFIIYPLLEDFNITY